MDQRLVTIAIPAYKKKWLGEAIESALSQDYYNLEILVVDDDSPQGLYDVVKPYLKDRRLKYYKNEKNLGKESIVLNWNKCVEYANGEFFVLLCDDDILEPNFVSTLISLADKYPNVNAFHSGKVRMHPDGRTDCIDPWPEFEDYDSFIKNKFYGHRPLTITEFMYRTLSIRTKKYVVFPIGYYSDDASLINLCQDGGIASSNKTYIKFRLNYEHISGNKTYQKEKIKALVSYYNWLKSKTFYNNYKKIILQKQNFELYENFSLASWPQRFNILFNIPNNVLNLKQKIGFIYQSLIK